MPKIAYASDCGIPKSVKTVAQLPKRGYVGATVYCEEDSTLYVYDGASYSAVGASGGTSAPATSTLTVVDKTTEFPENPEVGAFVYVKSTSAPYVYTGAAWKKVTIDNG